MKNIAIAIMLIDSEQAYQNLKATLANYTQKNQFGILCLANSKDLYLRVRKFLIEDPVRYGQEMFVAYKLKKKLFFKDALTFLKDGKYFFLWNNKTVIEPNGIDWLIQDATFFNRVGYIACYVPKTSYHLENIYDKNSKKEELQINWKRYYYIDGAKGANILTQAKLFRQFLKTTDNTLNYGIQLRQLGFVNVVDKNINYRTIKEWQK